MARQLKRWESPRREGRNHKGRGGSARQRQRRKQFQALRQKLKEQATESHPPDSKHTPQKGSITASFLFWAIVRITCKVSASPASDGQDVRERFG